MKDDYVATDHLLVAIATVTDVMPLHGENRVLERYGLGLQEHDRWSTMSTVKSMTAMLPIDQRGYHCSGCILSACIQNISRY